MPCAAAEWAETTLGASRVQLQMQMPMQMTWFSPRCIEKWATLGQVVLAPGPGEATLNLGVLMDTTSSASFRYRLDCHPPLKDDS
jgi:hypothetical protein